MTGEPHHQTLRGALEREHREIDAGIEAFLAAPEDADAAEGLSTSFTALRRHIYLEEEFLFPPLRAQGLMAPVLVMLKEHGELWDALDEMDRATIDGMEPEALQHKLEHVLDLLDRHNAKEEPIVYAAAERLLAPDAAARLNDLVSTRSLPTGWVCERARTH
ncbi:hemerythrin domain-containing protein [Angustibacter sp. Root456]|uniref:hemerythrin domain-containing protein n=1 Tax=Angustibacter sp. Root456 TaxID=1736539 RepID=UPI0006F4F24E|nr:hemerythrin domain-containing protein [Angustibacter sp. Root456]KQX69774.1 hypothetical protein ASD06_01740 [Angustibacter sp. Root456]